MKKKLLLFGLLAVAFFTHVLSQYQMFSLFLLITSVPLFIILITPVPALLIFSTFIVLELFSSLPHGSMALMFVIPYIVTHVWKKLQVEFSWKFLYGIFVIITLQTAALTGIVSLMNVDRALELPWNILAMQIFITSLGTFILAFIYKEYSERL